MIIKKDRESFQSYLEDTSNIKGKADILYIPEKEKDVCKILAECAAKGKPVTISSAGTGTTGGRVPSEGAILSMERLNKIIGIDVEKKQLTAQTGVTLGKLEEELNKLNLTLRFSPTEPLAFLGGAVSTCASGPKSFKYSSIRDYVESMKVVLTDGSIMDLERGKISARGRKFNFKMCGRQFNFTLPHYTSPGIKSSAGYFTKDDMDLIDLFIGHEGTLGCITQVSLKVQNMPLDYFDCIVFFNSDSDALNFIRDIKKSESGCPFYPCALEFFDNNSLRFLKEDYPSVPVANCAVYMEQEIEFADQQEKVLDYWCSLIEKHNSTIDKCWFAEDSKNRQRIYDFRHKLPEKINEFLRVHKQQKTATDISVPEDRFEEMYAFYKKTAVKSGLHYVNFGHIGQNHLHFNFLPRNREESFKAKGYILEFIRKAVSLNGTVSAEHGIGKIKKPYLEAMYDKRTLKQMAELKKVFDPACIIGLDNIFSREML